MRLPRMTTRRWIALVAVVAMAIEATQMRQRVAICRERAEFMATLGDYYERYLDYANRIGPEQAGDLGSRSARRRDFFRGRERSFRRAAFRPWLPIPPDPRK
jgi:hypothetical protein